MHKCMHACTCVFACMRTHTQIHTRKYDGARCTHTKRDTHKRQTHALTPVPHEWLARCSDRCATSGLALLQCAAVCCGVLQCAVVCCSVLQCAVVCCSALWCVAMHCSVLRFVVGCSRISTELLISHSVAAQLQLAAVFCSVLQRVTFSCKYFLGSMRNFWSPYLCCNVLQSALRSMCNV